MDARCSEDGLLRVASGTAVGDLAASIAHGVYDGKNVVLRAVGNGALGQAVKAVAVARGMVSPRGIDLSLIPGFCEVTMNDRDKPVTGVILRVVVN